MQSLILWLESIDEAKMVVHKGLHFVIQYAANLSEADCIRKLLKN